MSVEEYRKNLGRTYSPTLSEIEEDEVFNYWLQYRSGALEKNGHIPPQAEEAFKYLQEKRKNRNGSGKEEKPSGSTTIIVHGPLSGVVQTGNNNQANSSQVLPSENSSVKSFIINNIGSIVSGVIVAIILAWLGIENS